MVSGSYGLRVLGSWRILAPCGSVLEPLGQSSWLICGILGRPGQPWGPSCQVLGPLGGFLGRLGRNLVASWAFLEASWELLGPSWAQLDVLLGRLGGFLGASWAVLGAAWWPLGPSWRHLGSFLARRSRGILNGRPLRGILGGQKCHRSMYFTMLSACRRVRSKKGS